MFKLISFIGLCFSLQSFAITITYENNNYDTESKILAEEVLKDYDPIIDRPYIAIIKKTPIIDPPYVISMRPTGPALPPLPKEPKQPGEEEPLTITVELLEDSINYEEDRAYQGGHFIYIYEGGVRKLVYIPPPPVL